MNKHILLTIAACVGVGLTGYFAAKAGEEAYQIKQDISKKKETDIPKKAEKEYWPDGVLERSMKAADDYQRKELFKIYLPAVISGTATVVCIILNHKITRKELLAISSAGALSATQLNKYREKVREIFGKEADVQIMTEIAKEEWHASPNLPEGEQDEEIFYDPWTQREFVATPQRVAHAIYHLNRNFQLGGAIKHNELYEFIGIEPEEDDRWGWDTTTFWEDGLVPWLDICTHVEMRDGREVNVIYYAFDPWNLEELEEPIT